MRRRPLATTLILISMFACWMLVNSCGKKDEVYDAAKASVTIYNGDGQKVSTEYYYPNGKLRAEVAFNEEGGIGNRITYSYERDSLLVEKYDSANFLTINYYYDDQGRQVKEAKEVFLGTTYIYTYYSPDGMMRIDSILERNHVTVTRLDEAGNEREVWLLDQNRDTIARSESTYNREGLELENKYWKGPVLLRHRVRVYNGMGEIAEEMWYNAEGVMRMNYAHEFDDLGRIIKTTRFTDGKEDFRLEYEYKSNERTCTTYIPGVKPTSTREVYTNFREKR